MFEKKVFSQHIHFVTFCVVLIALVLKNSGKLYQIFFKAIACHRMCLLITQDTVTLDFVPKFLSELNWVLVAMIDFNPKHNNT